MRITSELEMERGQKDAAAPPQKTEKEIAQERVIRVEEGGPSWRYHLSTGVW